MNRDLDAARLLSFGRPDVTSSNVLELNKLVESSAPMLRQAAGKHVEVELSLHPEPQWFRGRSSDLDQILLNLVVNAREAMNGRGRISIQTSAFTEHGTHFASVDVADTGCGLDDAAVEEVFTPYYTTKPGNTGLGLATVARIVRDLGGRVRLERGEPTGATFQIQIPVVDRTPTDRNQPLIITDR